MNILGSAAFHRSTQVITVAVLVVDAVLLATGLLTPRQALLLFLVVELPVGMFVLLGLLATYMRQRRNGFRRGAAVAATMQDSPFWPIVRAEVRAYASLWFWARGRDAEIEPGGVAFRSNRGTWVLPVAFGVVTVIEIVVLHIVLPWQWLRVAVAVLSVWSLLALFGTLAVHRVRPHYMTPGELVLRQSGAIVAAIDRAVIASAKESRRFSETTPTVLAGRLYLPNMDGTNVDIVLQKPTQVRLPALLPRRRTTSFVELISIYVDDPDHLVTKLHNPATSLPERTWPN